MKIECEIADIKREEVIEAMAARLLGAEYDHDPDDPDDPPPSKWDRKAIGKHLRVYFEAKVSELAASRVRDAFDAEIKARIAAAVEAVLIEGWTNTNEYGEAIRGEKLTLKSRISVLLTKSAGDNYNRRDPLVDQTIKTLTEKFLGDELRPIVDEAKARLKTCLDVKVMETVSNTIATAVGLRR